MGVSVGVESGGVGQGNREDSESEAGKSTVILKGLCLKCSDIH